ncbi:PEP-utilizing enzyme [Pelagibius sp. CAU 1746]|uniref:PEP-utilizing enzyme n=1 Tax=Pelagibius sp. CAU 1746 TaxID=3140370 RepID=UPI00325BA41B
MFLSFSSKAETLALLRGKLNAARILPLTYFSVKEWSSSPEDVAGRVRRDLPAAPWIVRSSCWSEDHSGGSNAGAYLSIPDVVAEDFPEAVSRVAAAFPGHDDNDQVLVQPMLRDVIRSGVAFSHDPKTCAAYRVVNWAEGPDTTAITGGGEDGRIWLGAQRSPIGPPEELLGVCALLDELLELFGGIPVDCEFAVTREDDGSECLWLLQARPLVLGADPEDPEAQERRLTSIADKVKSGMRPHPFLMGERTIFGVMPDWNPAEIIGLKPRPLALSLYQDLVTDSIWAYQRHNYGYRNLRSFPLMLQFFGQPYIDVRLSFNSFIPADLEEGLAARLVDYYIDRLLDQPAHHDKVEFEIVFSCYTFDLPERLEKLGEYGFSQAEQQAFAESLRRLTNRIIHPKNGLWKADADKLDVLSARYDKLAASDVDPLERIFWLLEDAKRYGTLPFAGLARAGFIAVQMLQSLVAKGVFSQAERDRFMSSLSTVSGQLARDRGALDRATFLSRYGHLRPGTYDILSPRYDEAPDQYFDWGHYSEDASESGSPFSVSLPQLRAIVALLEEHQLHPDGVGLLNFLQAAIELRELAKFQFTRNLSDALSLIGKVGASFGFSPEDLSYCDIAAFRGLHNGATYQRDVLERSIEAGKAQFEQSARLSLPPVISRPEDVWAFELPKSEPNFITQKDVIGSVVTEEDRDKLAGAIVCIPNADPGYDWLFSYPIAGLITAWGGANSHMAIRAGERGLPAVIGAGQQRYDQWSASRRLHLDCANCRVRILA